MFGCEGTGPLTWAYGYNIFTPTLRQDMKDVHDLPRACHISTMIVASIFIVWCMFSMAGFSYLLEDGYKN